ncbi:hypothetical protein Leryth_007208 [Lithospermum erythrorhizon]|nr:hypothetical protein Leryth_007208 [Lithospermum erythrorhizon]
MVVLNQMKWRCSGEGKRSLPRRHSVLLGRKLISLMERGITITKNGILEMVEAKSFCAPEASKTFRLPVSNGPFCGHVDSALVFRVNSMGPSPANTNNLGIMISHQLMSSIFGCLSSVESPTSNEQKNKGGTVIREHLLDFLLTMNHSEEADNPVPNKVNLEIELDNVELELDSGGFALKKQMLDDRRFPRMHLDLLRLLQVTCHGEQPSASKAFWFHGDDINAIEELIGRLRRLKENVGFIANRVKAIQAGLDSWQAEQINKKLYYPLVPPLHPFISDSMFGMNVMSALTMQQFRRWEGMDSLNAALLCVLCFFRSCSVLPLPTLRSYKHL